MRFTTRPRRKFYDYDDSFPGTLSPRCGFDISDIAPTYSASNDIMRIAQGVMPPPLSNPQHTRVMTHPERKGQDYCDKLLEISPPRPLLQDFAVQMWSGYLRYLYSFPDNPTVHTQVCCIGRRMPCSAEPAVYATHDAPRKERRRLRRRKVSRGLPAQKGLRPFRHRVYFFSVQGRSDGRR